MSRVLALFSSNIERNAAFPNGIPDDVLTDITGVGLIEAGAGTARSIQRHNPSAIVFAGTCGAYRESGIAIGQIIVVRESVVASGDVGTGSMRLPTLMAARRASDEALTKRIVDNTIDPLLWELVCTGNVASTLGVTETDELAAALYAQTRCEAENLEAFAVLQAAGELPCAIVLGVTNRVGKGGGLDWTANYASAMQIVGALAVNAARTIEREM